MADSNASYAPPETKAMRTKQDSPAVLRLLLAQRRLYTRAKRWLNVQWAGMLIVGVSAPVVSLIWPGAAIVCGAVAGVWLFAGRTLFTRLHRADTAGAASIQDVADRAVFDMPAVSRTTLPLEEEISALVGPAATFDEAIDQEQFLGWYTFEDQDPVRAVAIAQRANVAYSSSLLRRTWIVWTAAAGVWTLLLLGASILRDVSLATFFLGVLLPVLPAGLDVFEYICRIRTAAQVREDLARKIDVHLRGHTDPLAPSLLLGWQDEMFRLRAVPAHVPDWLYRLLRSRAEREMSEAARRLSNPT